MQSWKDAQLKAYLCRLMFGSVVYNFWRNRNAIYYVNHPKSKKQLLKQIVWEVRIKILFKGKFNATKGNVNYHLQDFEFR
jgi:hypothetical protein